MSEIEQCGIVEGISTWPYAARCKETATGKLVLAPSNFMDINGKPICDKHRKMLGDAFPPGDYQIDEV